MSDVEAKGPFIVALERRVLEVRGPDTGRFLHGLCTQDVADLSPSDGRLAVFPNKKGRVVALAHYLQTGSDDVLLVYEGSALETWLDDYLFADDVEMTDASARYGCEWVFGDGASDWLRARFGIEPPAERWGFAAADSRVVVRTFDDVVRGKATPSFLVVSPEGVAAVVDEKGGITRVAPDVAQAHRVAAGIPATPGEVSERWNPLELALHDAISWTKGCYIGQEVVSRIDNYGKQARHLLGLRVPPSTALAVGARVIVDGEEVGELTSAGLAPSLRSNVVALAMCRVARPPAEPLDAEVVSDDGGRIPAVLVSRLAAQEPHD